MSNLIARQIIESLRTGVPIRAAVELVGSGQPKLEKQFQSLLDDIRRGTPRKNNGFVYFGDFGTGKSHVLEYFTTSAEKSNFVISRVTISKNLQLSNHRAVLSQLMSQMSTKDHREEALARILDDSTSRGFDYSSFQKWCRSEVTAGRLKSIYEGISLSLNNMRYGSEEFDKLMSYLAGSASQTEIRKAVGAPRAEVPPNDERTWETLHFVSNLFVHLGFNGWLLLFDELELIRMIGSQRAWVARGKSYAAITNWFGLDLGESNRTMASIGCMTSGWVEDIIDFGPKSWNDREHIPDALSASATPHLAKPALTALDFLRDQNAIQSLKLVWPDPEAKVKLQNSLRKIYSDAYGAKAPLLEIQGESFESIRIYIRRWIARWDLSRHGRDDVITVNAITQNFDIDEEEDDD